MLQQHRDELSPGRPGEPRPAPADLSIFQSLVEDLLEIARTDAGATALVIETVPAVELVRQSVRSAAQRHGLAEPPVEVEGDLDEVKVSVDRRRFERVMTNLIDNAHHYAGDAVAVRVAVARRHLAVDVDDAGPGVARGGARAGLPALLPRARRPRPQRRARHRTGLALVRDHVTAFSGTITAGQSPEGGARFEIAPPGRRGGLVRARVALALVRRGARPVRLHAGAHRERLADRGAPTCRTRSAC